MPMTMHLPWRYMYVDGDHNTTPIKTSVTQRETAELVRLARGKRVLEIGSAFGWSTVHMARVAASVVSVDPHDKLKSLGEFTANLARWNVSEKVTTIVGESYVEMCGMLTGSFDMIFIDGDHRYEVVKIDLGKAKRLLFPGGVLSLHDYGEVSCGGVRRAVDEVMAGKTASVIDTLITFVV